MGRDSCSACSATSTIARRIAPRSAGVDDLEEVALDPAQVGARGPPQPFEALVGQDGLRATRIGHALVTDDEPVGDEAVDEARHAALAEDHPVGERVHAQPPVPRLGQREQRVVFAERQVVLGPQLLIEPSRDPRVGDQERAPWQESLVAGGDGMEGIGVRHRPDPTPRPTR